MELKTIPMQTVQVFSPSGKLLGHANEYEFIEFQTQIATNKAEGYFVVYNDEVINFNSKGELEKWPVGLFDTTQKLFAFLFQARKKK